MSASANLLVRIAADITGFDRATRTALGRIKGLASDMEALGTRLSLGVTLPLAAFGGSALKAAGDIEALKLGLNSITKSATETERQFKALREVAKLPGLGLEEAVRGATNLQALGFSFEKSRQILLNFGNALAAVGRGRDDLNEVIRQLGQLGARGQVTADNLKPIIERVPQVATIIREKFGADALGNPAETFKKLGISAQELINILVTELGARVPQVTGGIKNAFENLSDDTKNALSDIGNALAKPAQAFVNDFASPILVKLGELGREFQKLPEWQKNTVLAFTGIAGAAPLVIGGLGAVVRITIETAGALQKLAAVLTGGAIVDGIRAIQIAFGAQFIGPLTLAQTRLVAFASTALAVAPYVALAGAIAYLGSKYLDLREAVGDNEKAADLERRTLALTAIALKQKGADIKELERRYKQGEIGVREFQKGLQAAAIEIGKTAKATPELASNLDKVGTAAKVAADKFKAIPFLEKSDEGRILAAQVAIIKQRYDELIGSIAKFRVQGGQQSIFDEKLPDQVDDVTSAMKRLDAQTSNSIVVQQQYKKAVASVPEAMFDYAAAYDAMTTAAAKGRQAFDTRDMEAMSKATEAELKKSEKTAKEFSRQVSLITNDVARNITDLIFQGGKFKDVMVDALESVAKALVRLALEKTLTSIAGKLTGLLTQIPVLGKALGGLFGGAAGSAAGAVGGQVAGSVAGSVGGQVAGQAIGGAIGAGGSAASTAAGIAGQAAGAGISAAVGIVTGAVSAISGVIGNFQFAAMNKSLDLIEKETRYSQIHLLNILEKLNQYLPMVNSIHDRLATIVTQGIGVYNAPGDGGLRLAPESIQIVVNGAGDPKAVAQMVVKELRLAGA